MERNRERRKVVSVNLEDLMECEEEEEEDEDLLVNFFILLLFLLSFFKNKFYFLLKNKVRWKSVGIKFGWLNFFFFVGFDGLFLVMLK